MKKQFIGLLIVGVLIVQGCASFPLFKSRGLKYKLEIDSIKAAENSTANRFIIAPGLNNVKPYDLQFKEYAAYVRRGLESKGYIFAENPEDAEFVVFLAYGISDPIKNEKVYSIPIWGQTGISSSYTSGTLNQYGNTTTYQGTTTHTPQYGITGTVNKSRTYYTYNRVIILNAFDLKAYRDKKSEVELWKTNISSVGSGDDFRSVFPVMLGGALEFIATDTKGIEELIVYERDAEVEYILGNRPSITETKK
jgi:hypothetical protein